MAATPLYNIDYPVSTDLVAQGYSQMQTLATDVETALQAQTQSLSTGYRNRVLNPTFTQNQRVAGTTSIADFWTYYVDSITGVTNTRNTLGVTSGLPEWVGGSMTQATASNAAGIARYVAIQTNIPETRNLSNQTVVVSFYAKASAGTPKVGINISQTFGTGGVPSADVNGTGQAVTISTSWARYSTTFTVPSVSGKTIGTNLDDATILRLWTSAGSNYNTQSGSIGLQTSTIDITGVQVELSYLTPLELRPTNQNWEYSSSFGPSLSWTPQMFQGVAVTTTVNYAAYTVIGKWCFAQCYVTAGSSGTASSALQIRANATLPLPKIQDGNHHAGSAIFNSVGTGVEWYGAKTGITGGGPYWVFYSTSGTSNITAPQTISGHLWYLSVFYEIA